MNDTLLKRLSWINDLKVLILGVWRWVSTFAGGKFCSLKH